MIHFSTGFIVRMAWRDSRSSRRRLLLFSISISLGVAALIGIGLFRASLAQAIDDQARSLLGATAPGHQSPARGWRETIRSRSALPRLTRWRWKTRVTDAGSTGCRAMPS